jgi:polyisoprenoid-binding protein YceI
MTPRRQRLVEIAVPVFAVKLLATFRLAAMVLAAQCLAAPAAAASGFAEQGFAAIGTAALGAAAHAAPGTDAQVTAAATSWIVDAARSRLSFTGTLAGGTFDGTFHRFRPQIVFDPAHLAGSRFDVEVDTASADTQEKDRDEALAGNDFFAVKRWPTARFVAERFETVGPGHYRALGRLTLRDVTRDVTVPFEFDPSADGRAAELKGSATIRRLDFGVGQGEWRDTAMLGDEVKIHFDLALRRE